MANTLIIVSDTGKYFEVNLDKGSVAEITSASENYAAIASRAGSGTTIAELTPEVEAALAEKAGKSSAILGILGTFVNLQNLS